MISRGELETHQQSELQEKKKKKHARIRINRCHGHYCVVHLGGKQTTYLSWERLVYTNNVRLYLSALVINFFFVFPPTYFYFPASGQAVVTGVVPSSPQFSPSTFFAHRQGSAIPLLFDFSSSVANSRSPLSESQLHTGKRPNEFKWVYTRPGSNSRNWPIMPGSRITWYANGATGQAYVPASCEPITAWKGIAYYTDTTQLQYSKGSARMPLFPGTHAPGRAGQHFDLSDSIFGRE